MSKRVQPWLLLCLAGCYSQSLMQHAETLEPAEGRVALGANADLKRLRNEERFVAPELAARLGAATGVDVAVKISGGRGFELGPKFRLWHERRLTISVAPTLKIYDGVVDPDDDWWSDESLDADDSFAVQAVSAPVLFGWRPIDTVQLLLAPDVQGGQASSNATGDERTFLGFGGHLGVALDVASWLSFIPECGLLRVLHGDPIEVGQAARVELLSAGQTHVQCSVSIELGGELEPP